MARCCTSTRAGSALPLCSTARLRPAPRRSRASCLLTLRATGSCRSTSLYAAVSSSTNPSPRWWAPADPMRARCSP
ncbi:ORFL253W.iORF3 [Human betaherpesvirus 5]|nr:ORFL253W.iORF3 [Human betaherpesvirus 5]QHX40628.1 ORFL253W.iORF3 [Human betaherpesvirus 5]